MRSPYRRYGQKAKARDGQTGRKDRARFRSRTRNRAGHRDQARSEEGARLVINDLDLEPAEETCRAVGRPAARRVPVVGSVTDPAFGEQFVQAALDEYGRHRHHRQQRRLHLGQRRAEDDRRAVVRDDRRPPDRAVPDPARRRALPARRARRPRSPAATVVTRKVVNISSIAGLGGNAGQAGYASGKAGIVGLTKTLAKEWGRYNVTVEQPGVRPHQDPTHRDAGRRRQHDLDRGPRDQGRHQRATDGRDGGRDPARPRRHARPTPRTACTCCASRSRTTSAARSSSAAAACRSDRDRGQRRGAAVHGSDLTGHVAGVRRWPGTPRPLPLRPAGPGRPRVTLRGSSRDRCGRDAAGGELGVLGVAGRDEVDRDAARAQPGGGGARCSRRGGLGGYVGRQRRCPARADLDPTRTTRPPGARSTGSSAVVSSTALSVLAR